MLDLFYTGLGIIAFLLSVAAIYGIDQL